MSKEINYENAMNELETIVAGIEDDQISIDELSSKVKRATELIKICQNKLYKTEKDIADVLSELEK
ncbi:MAG: exodeoxyribonuclease VII small subunit [Salibacteraceae bacterium]|jgi:exodeoxyribonuclease VII small subunit